MKIKNETEIQLMRILYKTNKKQPTKNIVSRRAYPYGVEAKYYRQLKGYFKPLIDYVNKYIDENINALLRGDSSNVRLDTIPGNSFDDMMENIDEWLSIYMPDFSDDTQNNLIMTGLNKTADEAFNFVNNDYQNVIDKGVHINAPITSQWWDKMKNSWAEDNYTLITSNAKNYVSKINSLTEQAIVNGYSHAKLKDEIKKATKGLSDKHCKLLARDQMGKLNGQITEAQMQEIGLDLYVWSTSLDDRVRDSHAVMEGLLCRWDDASVCSYDNGKTWVSRPSGAVELHPGQDFQCRCVGLTYYPELISNMQNVPMKEIVEGLPPVQEIEAEDDPIKIAENFYSVGVATKNEDVKSYIIETFQNTSPEYVNVMNKIAGENKKSINYVNNPKKASYFSSSEKKILLTHIDDESTLRHEIGHFLDNVMGKNKEVHFKKTGETYPIKQHLSFSQISEFSSMYMKEAKKMVNDLIKDAEKKNIVVDSYWTLNQYLSSKYPNMTRNEKATICDMFTAIKKKSFGGHPVSYFKNSKRESMISELKNQNILAEGFAELCETNFDLKTSKEFKDFLDDYFPNSVPIINKVVEDYLKK